MVFDTVGEVSSKRGRRVRAAPPRVLAVPIAALHAGPRQWRQSPGGGTSAFLREARPAAAVAAPAAAAAPGEACVLFGLGELWFGLSFCYTAAVVVTLEALKSAVAAGAVGGPTYFTVAAPFLAFFVAVPLLELLLPMRRPTVEASDVEHYVGASAPVFSAMQRMSLVLHIAACIYTYSAVSTLAMGGYMGLAVTMGVCSLGVNAIVGLTSMHDLQHSRNKIDRWLAKLWLSWECFVPYCLAHGPGHHANKMTRADFTAAEKGLPFPMYYLRYMTHKVGGSLTSPKRVMSIVGIPAAMAVSVYAAFGPVAAAMHFSQAFFASYAICVFDYLLHYGLVAEDIEGTAAAQQPGLPVDVVRTWRDPYPLTNLTLFNVLNHAHHHWSPRTPPSKLQNVRGGPAYPLPPTLIALAVAVPPLLEAIMHPTLERHLRDPAATSC
eukprot:jgi/Tetstr1/456830/TSEL_043504.t1